MNFFSFDSPFMSFLGKAAEYMIISLLTLLFSLPIVTAGAAFTAQYYVGIKLIRGEDTPFFKAYIKSFKENFKQSTVIWLIELLIGGFLAFDWWLIFKNGADNFNQIFKILLLVVTVYFVMSAIAVFALLSRFVMTIKEAIKGALVYTYINVPRMLFVILLTVFPTAASLKYPDWLAAIWPVGSAACLYIISYNFNKSFKKLELSVRGTDEDGNPVDAEGNIIEANKDTIDTELCTIETDSEK